MKKLNGLKKIVENQKSRRGCADTLSSFLKEESLEESIDLDASGELHENKPKTSHFFRRQGTLNSQVNTTNTCVSNFKRMRTTFQSEARLKPQLISESVEIGSTFIRSLIRREKKHSEGLNSRGSTSRKLESKAEKIKPMMKNRGFKKFKKINKREGSRKKLVSSSEDRGFSP